MLNLRLKGPPPLDVTIDDDACVDARNGQQVEGKPPVPDVLVELDPKDVAKGVDTQLEAAAALVRR